MFSFFKLPKLAWYNNSKSENHLTYCLLCLIFFAIAIFLRYPDFILDPRVWAEDRIYIETFLGGDNWWDGFDALMYPSYYTFLPRFGAMLASFVDISRAPLILNLFGFLVLFIPLLIIFLTNSQYWENLQQKIILSLFLILSCSTGEIWLTSINLGFIGPIITFLILLDDNLKSKTKTTIYTFLICINSINGVLSLLMAPFFLLRLIRKREKPVFYYCLAFLIFGSFHLLFYYISNQIGTGNVNRMDGMWGIIGGGDLMVSPEHRLIYLFQFNLIFPLFGYYLSYVFRVIFELINNLGASSSYISLIIGVLPHSLDQLFLGTVKYASLLSGFINILITSLITFFIYYIFKSSRLTEKINFLGIYIFLSLLISFLSIGGHGGFRYSYITSFILLFYLYVLSNKANISNRKRSISRMLIIFSLTIGTIEYKSRTLSFTPNTFLASTVYIEWPRWEDEVARWKKDNLYKPVTWPYLKNKDLFFSEKNTIYSINLNEAEDWNREGRNKFSVSLKKLLKGEKLIKNIKSIDSASIHIEDINQYVKETGDL